MTGAHGAAAGVRAVVVGSGIGGLCAAARLVAAGASVTVVEAADRFGGRLGTDEVDGFLLSSGALALAFGDELEESFRMVDAPYDLVRPQTSVVIRLGGHDLKSGAVWRQLAKGATVAIERLTASLGSADQPAGVSVSDWVAGYTKKRPVHKLFESMCHTIYTARPDQVPIQELAALLRRTGGFKDFGYSADGNVVLVDGLVDTLRRRGVVLETRTRAVAITSDEDGVTGVQVQHGQAERHLPADVVFSNVGPQSTAALVPTGPYAAAFDARLAEVRPARFLAMYVASTFPITPHTGLLTLTDFERASSLGNLSAAAPALAPPGWNLYFTGTVPPDDFDLEHETSLMVDDLRRVNDDLFRDERSRIVRLRLHDGLGDPGHRTLPGHEVDVLTPLPGLYEVGDGAKPRSYTGTSGAAAAARIAVDHLTSTLGEHP